MGNIFGGPLIIDGENGLVSQLGISEHKKGMVLGRTSSHIAVRWPGGKAYQTARARSVSYPPTIMVFAIDDVALKSYRGRQEEIISVRHLLDWDAGRKRIDRDAP